VEAPPTTTVASEKIAALVAKVGGDQKTIGPYATIDVGGTHPMGHMDGCANDNNCTVLS